MEQNMHSHNKQKHTCTLMGLYAQTLVRVPQKLTVVLLAVLAVDTSRLTQLESGCCSRCCFLLLLL